MDFQIKAVRGREIVLLNISAAHGDEANALAKARGYSPIGSITTNSSSLINRESKKFPLALFSQELLALLEAGINLVEAIEALAEKEQRGGIKHTLDSLLQALY